MTTASPLASWICSILDFCNVGVNIEGIGARIPSIDDLILNKRATGRTKDLADAEALESLKSFEQRH